MTGAASGIGLATVKALVAVGADVYRVVQAEDDIPSGSNEAERQRWLVADVRDRAAVGRAFSTLESRAGRLDVIVSCAGVARHGTLPEIPPEDVELMIATNLIGFFNVMALGVPLLQRSGGGAVVAVSSVHAVASSRLASVYAATKAGLVAAVKVAALDHARDGIRVNAILPGSVDTPMLRSSARRRLPEDPDRAIRDWGAAHPLGRVLSASEIASSILFLAGADASGITGSVLTVDGGLLARLAL